MNKENLKWGKNKQKISGSLPQREDEKKKEEEKWHFCEVYSQPKGKTVNPGNNILNVKGAHEIYGNIMSLNSNYTTFFSFL